MMLIQKLKCIATLVFLILDCYVLSLSARLSIERGDQDSFNNPNCDCATGGICSCNGTSNANCVPNSNVTTCKRCQCSSTHPTFLSLDYENGGRCVEDRHLFSLSAAFGCYEFVESAILVTDTRNCSQQCQKEKEIAIPHKGGENSCFIEWEKLHYLNNDKWKQLQFRDEIFTIVKRKTNRTFLQLNFTKARNKWDGLIVKLQFFCASGESAPVNNTGTKYVVIKFKGTAVFSMQDQCSTGWKEFGNSCYLFVKTPSKTWEDSCSYCKAFGGELVSITNSSEVDFIYNQIKNLFNYAFWIGLYRKELEGWVWSDGSDFTNSIQWKPGQPDNNLGNKKCAVLVSTSKYSEDYNCERKYSSICEGKKGDTTPIPVILPPTSGLSDPLKCEYGWESYNRSCYKFESTSLRKRSAAIMMCTNTGSHLVKIDNDNEQVFLTSKVRPFQQPKRFWIGLNIEHVDIVTKRYAWESDNTLPSFFNWQYNEPNNAGGNENCVQMYGDINAGFWNDVRCSDKLLYICEKEVVIVTLEATLATVLENVNIVVVLIKVTGPLQKSIRLNVHTFDVTADSGDYIAKTETITLDSTSRQHPFNVTIKDDNIVENNEIFGVNITTADTQVNILDSTLFITIKDNDIVTVTLEAAPATVLENVNMVVILIKATGTLEKSIRLNVHTFDVTADSGDYIAKTETITLDSTTRQHPFIVAIKDDNIVENNEIFGVNITTADTQVNILNNTLFITIKDNDKLTLYIGEPSYNIQENSGKLTVTVIATGITAVPINGSKLETDNGTAKEPLDYTKKEENFIFLPGEVSKNVDIQINDDGLIEGEENFLLRLTKTNNEQITLGSQSTSVVLIQDDDDKGSCLSEKVGTVNALGVFAWPETKVGRSATIPCPYNFNVSATRECKYKDKTFREIIWGSADDVACPYKQPRSQRIFDLSEANVNSSNAIEVSEVIKNLSYADNNFTADDIENTASVLENIVAVKEKANEVADNFFDTVDNILDVPLKVVIKGQRATNSSLRIVDSLNTLLEAINITKTGDFQRTLRNFAVYLSIFSPSSSAGVTFSASTASKKTSSSLTNHSIVKDLSDKDNISPKKSTAIHLPRSLFDETTSSVNFSTNKIVLIAVFKDTKFFRVLSNASTNYTQRLNSYVIAGSIKGQSVSNLKTPVVLTFPNLKSGDKDSALCGFWDFSQARWSHKGCAFHAILEDGRIVCHCNHLTNFAMLMDTNPNDETGHEKVLSLISYIGCGVSLLGLLLTIFTILFFKDLRSKTPNRILLNLCIALSLTLVVFLCAAERSKTSSMASCRVAALALHYFVLVTFMWMAIEAFNMYLLFVKVMPSYFSKFILKCCIVAWGIPAVIVSITMGVAPGNYGDTKYCRVHGVPFLVSFLAPVLLILFGNFIAFVLIFRSLLTSGRKLLPNRRVSAYQQLRQGVTISILLGLTWMFGIFAINDAKVVFQYLFCIFNSLQGLFIFIFYCVLSLETRKKYKKHFLTTGKNSKRKKRFLNEGDDSPRKGYTTATSETGV